jgi:hypothetical protein
MAVTNADIKKVISKVKAAQSKLQGVLKNQDWVEEARKYAERQGTEVKKLLSSDLDKVKIFLEKERKELERIQKQIPGEVKKLKGFVSSQRKELERLLTSLRKAKVSAATKTKKKTTKVASASKSAH